MLTIVAVTWLELVRRRFIAVALGATLLLIVLTSWGFWHLAHTSHAKPGSLREMMVVASILLSYLFSFVLAVGAIALAAPSIASDVENGTLLPILARPVSRTAIVLGKMIALALVVCTYAALGSLGEYAAIRATTGYWPPHPFMAAFDLAALSAIMVVLGVYLSTRLSSIASSIAGIALFGMAWIGGIAGSIGAALGNATLVHAGTLTALLVPTDVMWRSAIYALQPAALLIAISSPHNWPGPFFVTATEPASMTYWTIAWLITIAMLAVRSFHQRDI